MENWTRPHSLDFPSVWNTFEGRNVNGFKRKYWIQDLTDEYKDEVLHHMSTSFLAQEKLFKSARVPDDPKSVQEFLTIWEKAIEQKVSLICLTKEEDGRIIRLVGCNVLAVMGKKEPLKLTIKGKRLKMALNAIHDINAVKDIYSELKVDEYLDGVGMYVLPEFRGEGIGTEMLKSRRELSLAVYLKASVTLFSTIGGQKCAEKAGFKDIVVFPYKDLNKLNCSYTFDIEDNETALLKKMYNIYSE